MGVAHNQEIWPKIIRKIFFLEKVFLAPQLTLSCSKSTTETLEKCVKYVQS